MSLKEAEREVLAAYEQRGQVPVRFFKRATLDKQATKEKGRNVFKDEVFLEKFKDKNNIFHKKASQQDMLQYAAQYEAFLANNEQVEDGTPVDYLPMITPAQLENLKICKVFTIERLADCGHSVLADIGHGSMDLQQRAKEYLNKASLQNEELSQVKAELEALKKEKTEKVNESTNVSAKHSGRDGNNTKANKRSNK